MPILYGKFDVGEAQAIIDTGSRNSFIAQDPFSGIFQTTHIPDTGF